MKNPEHLSLRRQAILQNLRAKIQRGEAIIGAGAGTGLSAKCEDAGGVDLIIIYNSGSYRMAGRGSLAGMLAYGNANDIVLEMAHEVLPVVQRAPVLAGVNGTDPFVIWSDYLERLEKLGFAGVQNFPTVGLFDGLIRQQMEESGISYDQEVEVIRMAHERGFLTTPYVFNPEEARKMTRAGADIIVVHLGLTAGGHIGAQTRPSLAAAIELCRACADAALAERPDVLVICHGGPIAEPEDAMHVMQAVPQCQGFYGASSMERLPVEIALLAQAQKFVALRLPHVVPPHVPPHVLPALA